MNGSNKFFTSKPSFQTYKIKINKIRNVSYIKCVIAPSFADIFYNNCFKNGILPIVLPPEEVEALMEDAKKGSNARISVDLESQTVTSSEGEVFNFKIDPFRKHCLKNGLDDIDLTLEKVTSIEKFEERASLARPWV